MPRSVNMEIYPRARGKRECFENMLSGVSSAAVCVNTQMSITELFHSWAEKCQEPQDPGIVCKVNIFSQVVLGPQQLCSSDNFGTGQTHVL